MDTPSTINRTNNFDFLRLLLASLVIVSHSYPLTGEKEILAAFTNDQLDFGSLAVNCFFVLSGFFIFISLQRSKTLKNYLWKRLLRLYPALFLLMLVTLIIIPFVYSGTHPTYTLKYYYSYALRVLSLYDVGYFIPGVFENNPYKGAINGSLWSLSYEFTMYISLAALFLLRKKRISFLVIALVFFTALFLHLFHPKFLEGTLRKILLDSTQLYRLTTYFFAGSLLVLFNFSQINTLLVRISLFTILLASLYFGYFQMIAPFILPPFILFIGLLKTPGISTLGEKFGDISYGVYIYGFLVQQTFMNFFNLNSITLTLVSLPVTYILAYFSWHFLEEKMMHYKNAIQ